MSGQGRGDRENNKGVKCGWCGRFMPFRLGCPAHYRRDPPGIGCLDPPDPFPICEPCHRRDDSGRERDRAIAKELTKKLEIEAGK